MSRNGHLWRLQPGLHGLMEQWDQVYKFSHGERNQAVHECLPYRVNLRWCYLFGCGRCDVLPHPLDVRRIGLGHPFLGCLPYFILLLLVSRLRLALGRDLLYLASDCVESWLLPFLFMWALRRIVPRFLTIKTMHARFLTIKTMHAGLTSFRVSWCDWHQLPLVLLLWSWWIVS